MKFSKRGLFLHISSGLYVNINKKKIKKNYIGVDPAIRNLPTNGFFFFFTNLYDLFVNIPDRPVSGTKFLISRVDAYTCNMQHCFLPVFLL